MHNFSDLEEYLDGIAAKMVAGCACLVYKGEKEVYRHYAGWRRVENRDNLKDDTLYRLYSLTKIAITAAVMRLVQEGKAELDMPVGEILKSWRNSEITIRHLLTMQSGLPYPSGEPGTETATKMILDFRAARKSWTTREYADMLAEIPPLFKPGTHFLYGPSYDVLGAVIEEISGMTLGKYLKENLFLPLHMSCTSFKIQDAGSWNRLAGIYSADPATGKFLYRKEKDWAYREDSAFEEGGGGLLSTIDDTMKLALMFQRGGKNVSGQVILTEDSMKRLTENTLDTNEKQQDFCRQFYEWRPALDGSDLKIKECFYGYGMGIRVRILKSRGIDTHIGEFGWYGMSGNYIMVDRESGITAVYLQQMIPGMEKEIHPALRRKICEALYED